MKRFRRILRKTGQKDLDKTEKMWYIMYGKTMTKRRNTDDVQRACGRCKQDACGVQSVSLPSRRAQAPWVVSAHVPPR